MNDPRLIAAAAWAARLSALGEGRAPPGAFTRWRADPRNAAAYDEVAASAGLIRAQAEADGLQALRRATLGRVARRSARRSVAPRLAAAAAALLIVAAPLGLALRSLPSAAAPTEYRTEIGQKLDVTLEDGSRVTLDTASRVRLAYSARERRLILLAGQARFDVAKHQPRPFIVEAAGQQVTAHGTAFDVRLERAETRVALIEGRVTVAGRGRAVAMQPGELLVAGARGMALKRDPGAVAAITSWNEGLVVAQNQPLGQVVAEMNRYARHPLRVAGPAAAIRVSGAFRAGATESFAEALTLGFPVRAERAADGAILLTAAAPKN